jgi:NAD(P)-dependent dehydrogenase (short-subunit alcohol dehydrogenase family)
MKPPYPAPVDEWHVDTYDAINPTRPELSQAGKVIVITGAGQGIGRETVDAYAQAGATTFHILGRTQRTLEETKNIIEKKYHSVQVTVHVADISDKNAVEKAAKSIGTWDVLAANAGYLPEPALITENPEDWWKAFEVMFAVLYLNRMLAYWYRSTSKAA